MRLAADSNSTSCLSRPRWKQGSPDWARRLSGVFWCCAPWKLPACLPALLVLCVTVPFAWWFFASVGTPDGYPGDSGRCPASNIPPQWPDWIPA